MADRDHRPDDREPTVTVVRKYRLIRHLGSGGMADVYLAESIGAVSSRRYVAFKRLRPPHSDSKTIQGYFRREARVGMELRHPNIVQVFDAGRDSEQRPFLVMELIDGTTLDTLTQATDLPLDTSLYVVTQVLHALAHAHEHNVVHRDVSPQNILIARTGVAKLADFGLAKVEHDSVISSAGVKGKWIYMAPELAKHRQADPRSDLYSVGVVLYELATGQLPYGSAIGAHYLARTLQGQPLPPSELRGDLPAKLEAIILRLLQHDADDRYQAATEVIEDVATLPMGDAATLALQVCALASDSPPDPPDLLTGEPRRATASPPAEPDPPARPKRRPFRAAAAFAMLMAIAAAGGAMVKLIDDSTGRESPSLPVQIVATVASEEVIEENIGHVEPVPDPSVPAFTPTETQSPVETVTPEGEHHSRVHVPATPEERPPVVNEGRSQERLQRDRAQEKPVVVAEYEVVAPERRQPSRATHESPSAADDLFGIRDVLTPRTPERDQPDSDRYDRPRPAPEYTPNQDVETRIVGLLQTDKERRVRKAAARLLAGTTEIRLDRKGVNRRGVIVEVASAHWQGDDILLLLQLDNRSGEPYLPTRAEAKDPHGTTVEAGIVQLVGKGSAMAGVRESRDAEIAERAWVVEALPRGKRGRGIVIVRNAARLAGLNITLTLSQSSDEDPIVVTGLRWP